MSQSESIMVNNETRQSELNWKFCTCLSGKLSERLHKKFSEHSFVSLKRVFNEAKIENLSDPQKPNYDIIEISSFITDGNGKYLVMHRGDASIITKGFSVLYSFSPIGGNWIVGDNKWNPNYRSAIGILPEFQRDYTISHNSNPDGFRLFGVVHNIVKKEIDDVKREINYFFIVFEMLFSDLKINSVIPKETKRQNCAIINWKTQEVLECSSSFEQSREVMLQDIDKKQADRVILAHSSGEYDRDKKKGFGEANIILNNQQINLVTLETTLFDPENF